MKAILAYGEFNPHSEKEKGYELVIDISDIVDVLRPNVVVVYPLTKKAKSILQDLSNKGLWSTVELFPIVRFFFAGNLEFLHLQIPDIKISEDETMEVPSGFQWPTVCFSCNPHRPDCKTCFA